MHACNDACCSGFECMAKKGDFVDLKWNGKDCAMKLFADADLELEKYLERQGLEESPASGYGE